MGFSRYGFLVIAAVVFVCAQQSEGNMTAALSQSTEAEKFLASERFQSTQDAIINAGKDLESRVAKETIQRIRKAAMQCQAAGVPALTVNTVLDGIVTTLRLVSTSARKANDAIDKAMKLKDDPIAAAEVIRKGAKADETIIYAAGVPIHDAQGSALALAGGAAQQGLRNSVISVQKAGTVAFEALEVAAEIANLGIKAGGPAADEGFKAAKAVVASAGLTVYTYIIESAKYAFDALRNAASKGTNQGDLASGIFYSLNARVSTNNPAALDAVARLKKGSKSLVSNLKKKSSIDAAKIMTQGLVATILETADAISVAKKALVEAGKLANQDNELAIATAIHRGIKAAQDEVISGSANAYLGLGAAGKIAGKQAMEGLIPAVFEVEYGRVAAYENLKLAEKTVFSALRARGFAAAQGISAAIQICEAAGSALYTQLVDGGEIGFDVLRSV